MRIAILTNEYPPNVYGGAGVHVEYLTRELASLDNGRHRVRVLCFGDQAEETGNLSVEGVRPPVELTSQDPRHAMLFSTLLQCLVMGGTLADIDLVHCHTWYTHFGGCLAKYLHGVPLVLTTHSLEPRKSLTASSRPLGRSAQPESVSLLTNFPSRELVPLGAARDIIVAPVATAANGKLRPTGVAGRSIEARPVILAKLAPR
jgi:glycosyltransferase involved in cell wall biosynthesis